MKRVVKQAVSVSVLALVMVSILLGKEIEPAAINCEKELKSGVSGWSVALFGGANVNRPDDLTASGVGYESTLSTKNSALGGVGGVKVGYDFAPFNKGSVLEVAPALEFEGFYTGFKHECAVDEFRGGGLEGNVNLAVFSLNPLLKFKYQLVQCYGGLGLGWTYASTDKITGTGILSGLQVEGENSVIFTMQGIAGVDVWVAKNWSLFTEYKYLNLLEERGKSNATEFNVPFDHFGMHLVTAGVRYHF